MPFKLPKWIRYGFKPIFAIVVLVQIYNLAQSEQDIPEVVQEQIDTETRPQFAIHYHSEDEILVAGGGLSTETVRPEPVVYIHSCRDKSEIHSGDLVIWQSPYKAKTADGKRLPLSCEEMPISQALIDALNQSAKPCIDQASEAIGWSSPESVALKSLLIYIHKGNSERTSLHGAARAIDISEFVLHYPEGLQQIRVEKASLLNSPNPSQPTQERKFLQTFRKCWSEYLIQDHNCKRWSHRERGSVGWEHKDHQKHLHLSVPYCPMDLSFYSG